VGENAQEGNAGQRGDEGGGDIGAAQEEEEGGSWTEQLRDVDEEVLIARVQAMLGQIRSVGVV